MSRASRDVSWGTAVVPWFERPVGGQKKRWFESSRPETIEALMSSEQLNTLATLATCVIVATTAIAALIQLRHLRASNQIQGQLAINALIQSEEFRRAQITIQGLSDMISDPTLAWAFRVPMSESLPPKVIAMRSAARVVGSNLENIGNMVRNGLTDGRLFIEQFGGVASESWDLLEPLTRVRRKLEKSDAPWEDFEYLTILSREWIETRGTVFPRTRRRLLHTWSDLNVPDLDEPTTGNRHLTNDIN